MRKKFVFQPPLTPSNLETIRAQVFSSLSAGDIPRKQYFESSLQSLVQYAQKKREKQNYTLLVGEFKEDWQPGREMDEERIWMEENVWVEIKVLGGSGDMFSSRFMATQYGLSKVDWKRKAFRSLKTGSSSVLTHAAASIIPSTWRLSLVQERQKQRAQQRLIAVSYDAEKLFDCILGMPQDDLGSAEFLGLGERLYEALGGHRDSGLKADAIVQFVATVQKRDWGAEVDLPFAGTDMVSLDAFQRFLLGFISQKRTPQQFVKSRSAEVEMLPGP